MAHSIQTEFLPALRERVAKVNKRARKLGVEGVRLEISEPYEKTYQELVLGKVVEVKTNFVDVEVHGPSVKLPGWSFLARIDHFEGLVYTTPDVPEDADFSQYTQHSVCQHCHVNRDRKHTFILQDEDGLDLQVGSTCIKDFLGHDVNLYFAFDAPAQIEDEFFGGSFTPDTGSLTEVLVLSSAVTRTDGWVPKSREVYATSTSETVAELLFNSKLPDHIRNRYEITDEDVETAERARQWALDLDPRGNDYLSNLRQIATNDFVTAKSMGLAVSMIAAHARAEERRITREREKADASPVPETDERLTIEGVITKRESRANPYGGYYGPSTRLVVTVLDDRGFKVWGTLPSKISRAREGDRVRFVAKVRRGDKDESFGFFNRPSKAELLTEVSA